jgi:uncharacterized protein with GYD domain
MMRFLSLLTFTDQGMQHIEASPRRAADFRATVEKAGGRLVAQYWAVGEIDGCIVFEAPDENTAASLLLKLGSMGNVRPRTMRVYDEKEFASLLGTIG